jgi:hypothetical protein
MEWRQSLPEQCIVFLGCREAMRSNAYKHALPSAKHGEAVAETTRCVPENAMHRSGKLSFGHDSRLKFIKRREHHCGACLFTFTLEC